MSSELQPNAFDLMLSSSKKRSTTESPSNDSKTNEPKPPTSINPNLVNPVESANDTVEDSGNLNFMGSDITSSAVKRTKPIITPDQSVTELRKKAAEFDPQRAAFWGKDEKVPFMFVAKGLDAMSKGTGRNAIIEIVCNMLRTVMVTTPEDLVRVVYILSNTIAPVHEGLRLGLGVAILTKALAESYETIPFNIENKHDELGDLGLVAFQLAEQFHKSQRLFPKPEALTVREVFETFHTIAKECGDNQTKKKKYINKLLVAASDCEAKYLIRLILHKICIGLGEKTLLIALGHAALYTEEKPLPPANMTAPLVGAAKILQQVYLVLPVYDRIVSALLSGSVWDLPKKCNFTLGVPIRPMLPTPTRAVYEILDKFKNMQFTCEYMYDGERAQIHYMEDGSVEIFNRNTEKITGKFLDVVATVSRQKHPSVTSFVLDSVIVAYDREKEKILPSVALSTRIYQNVEVCLYAFDILYVNRKTLLKEQLRIRRQYLYKSFEEASGYFQFAVAITSNDVEEIQNFFIDSIDSSCKGMIIKTLDRKATYKPSKQSNNWLTLKKDYIDSILDSLDVILN